MIGSGFAISELASRTRGFSPSSLDLLAWYDPSDIGSLFQDHAMTVPVTADGDPVGAMMDKSGNGYHLTQTTGSSRPTYKTDGVLRWLESDGADDSMSVASRFGLGANPDLTMTVGLRILGPGNGGPGDRIWYLGANSGGRVISGGVGTEGWSFRHDAGNEIYNAHVVGADYVVRWERPDGGNIDAGKFFENGVEKTATSSASGGLFPDDTTEKFSVFANDTDARQVNIRMYQMIVTATPSPEIEAYCASKSGVEI